MRRELGFGVAALRRRPALLLAAWSVPEVLPTVGYGVAVAHATDAFLAGRPEAGLGWLGALIAAAGVGAVGARQTYQRLGDLVEPVRDELVRLVVGGAVRRGAAGQRTDGAVSRLNRQVEIVRDTYAGLILVIRSFAITVAGVATGLLSLAPIIALIVVPPFLLGFAASLGILGRAAHQVEASLSADEQLTTSAGTAFAGVRDITASGAEDFAAELVGEPIDAHAAAERALARVAALRTLCFAIGGWLPLLLLLATGPWLLGRGVSTGTLLGGLTYVLLGLQPALNTVMSALGDSGLRYVVTLGRILDSGPPPDKPGVPAEPRDHQARLHKLSFAYGAHAEPVLHKLDLVVPDGDHLAVVGPSGIGKSTLAGLVCGLLAPTGGRVTIGRVPPAQLAPELLARYRVLIPQEAYVFSGTVADNVSYLAPDATAHQLERAIEAVGAGALVARLGGTRATLHPALLSAGERQLIALARAYLSPAPLAVLDEATCHLDPEAERRAEEAFAARPGSLIVVAHRISSALRARRILVLDGDDASLGRHSTLLRTSPLYRDLLGHWQPAQHSDQDQIQPAS